MIPKRMRSVFSQTSEKHKGDNIVIEGKVVCCESDSFEIAIYGIIKNGLLLGEYLTPDNNIVVMNAQCKKCGNFIRIFDSSNDGYGCCDNRFFSNVMPITFNCKKCGSNNYSMNIKYEYPNKNELGMLGINEPDNAFTWIWITLKCNNCGKTYKNIVDIETD